MTFAQRINLSLILPISLLFSTALLLIGIIKNPNILKTSWLLESSHWNLGVYAIGFIVASVLAVFFRGNKLYSGFLILLAAFACISVGIPTSLIVVIFFFSSLLIGRILARQLANVCECSLFCTYILTGSSVYCLLLYLLSHTSYNTPQIYSALLILPLVICPREIYSTVEICKSEFLSLKNFTRLEQILTLLIVFVLSIHLHQTLRPEFDFDALAAHLMIPHFVKVNAVWSFDYTQFVFGMNQLGADLFYSFVYTLTNEQGVRFLNLLFLCLLLKQVFELSRIWAPRSVSLLVLIALVSSPVMFTQTTTLHIEVIWICFLLGLNTLTLSLLSKDFMYSAFRNLLILIAIIAGTALSIKMPTLFYLPFIGLAVLFSIYKSAYTISEKLVSLTSALGVFLMFGVIQYAYCYKATGNPVFPYFNGIFKSPYFYQTSFNNPIFNRPLSFRTIYDMTFHGSWYLESQDYPLAIFYLAFFLPLVIFMAFKVRDKAILLIGSQVFIAATGIYIFQSYFRYLLPSFVLFSALLASFINYLILKSRGGYILSVSILVISIPLSLIHIPDATHHYREFDWERAISRHVVEDYIYKRPQQVIFDFLNAKYGSGITALHLQQPLVAGLDATNLVNAWYNPELAQRISKASNVEQVSDIVSLYGISHIISYSSVLPSQAFTEFLSTNAFIEMHHGPMTLYKINFIKIPQMNLINKFPSDANGYRNISLGKTRNYLLRFVLRSGAKRISWSNVVVWKDSKDQNIGTRHFVDSVPESLTEFEYVLEAPPEAVSIVMSSPSSTEAGLIREEFSFIALGDSLSFPKYQGP